MDPQVPGTVTETVTECEDTREVRGKVGRCVPYQTSQVVTNIQPPTPTSTTPHGDLFVIYIVTSSQCWPQEPIQTQGSKCWLFCHPAQHRIPDKEKSQRVDKQTFPALWKWPSGNQTLEREGFSGSSEVIFKEHSGSSQVKIKQKEVGLGKQVFKGDAIKEKEEGNYSKLFHSEGNADCVV